MVDERGRSVVTRRNARLAIFDEHDRDHAVESLPYGARVVAGETGGGEASGSVRVGDRIAEWDPYNHLVVAERDGVVAYRDLIPGLTYREDIDEATGASRRVVTDWAGAGAAAARVDGQPIRLTALKPSLALVDEAGEPIQLQPGVPARSLLSIGAIIQADDGAEVRAGAVLARIPRHSATSTDITGGLPRLEALFNVHGSKEGTKAIIASTEGRVRFGPVRGNNRRLIIEPTDPAEETVEFNVPKDRHIAVQEGALIRQGDYLIDGDPAPQDILDVYGEEEGKRRLARYLIDESHKVYRASGRGDQRQAHRGDRPPDAAQGDDR